MKKRFLCVALAPALVALGGCSALGINFSDDKVQYNAAQSRTNLEVPPDLAPIPQNDRFDIPARRGAVSANDEAVRRLRLSPKCVPITLCRRPPLPR